MLAGKARTTLTTISLRSTNRSCHHVTLDQIGACAKYYQTIQASQSASKTADVPSEGFYRRASERFVRTRGKNNARLQEENENQDRSLFWGKKVLLSESSPWQQPAWAVAEFAPEHNQKAWLDNGPSGRPLVLSDSQGLRGLSRLNFFKEAISGACLSTTFVRRP